MEQIYKIQHSFRAGLTAHPLKLFHECVKLSCEYVFFLDMYLSLIYMSFLLLMERKESLMQ